MKQLPSLGLLLLAAAVGLPQSGADETPTHPRGFAAYQRHQGQLQTVEAPLLAASSATPVRWSSRSGDLSQGSAGHNSVGLQLALCICLVLCSFAAGWRVCAGQSRLQLEAAALRFQADFDTLRHQQLQDRARDSDGADQATAVPPARQLALGNETDIDTASEPSLSPQQQVISGLPAAGEASAAASATTTLQPVYDAKPDLASPTPDSPHQEAAFEAADSQSSSTSVAEDTDLVLVRQPPAASPSGTRDSAAAAAASTAVSTPARPPNQRMQDTAMSPATAGTSLFSQAEISDAAALVAAIHVGLKDQGVPDAQRALVADNVLSTLDMQKRQQHHEASFRQGEEANQWHKIQGMAAVSGLSIKRRKAEAAIADKKLKALRATLADELQFGLCIMLASVLYCAYCYGLLQIRLGRCRSLSSLQAPSLLRPWVVLQLAEVLVCWACSAWQFLTGSAAMLLVAKLVCMRGWSSDTHEAPLMKLALGLGLLCGLIGYMTIAWTGGLARVWLVLWEVWVLLHAAAAWKMAPLLTWLEGRPSTEQQKLPLQHTAAAWRPVLFHLVAAAILPLAAGILPFTLAVP